MSKLSYVPVVFGSSGSSFSQAINTEGMQVTGVICSSIAFNSTAITFFGEQSRTTSRTFKPVINSTAGTFTIQTGSSAAYIVLKQDEVAQLNSLEVLKVQAGTLEVAGASPFILVMQPRTQS